MKKRHFRLLPLLLMLLLLAGLFTGCGFNELSALAPHNANAPAADAAVDPVAVKPEVNRERNTQKDLPELDVTEDPLCGEIKNIALFGVDTRSSDSVEGLSDCIIILSLDGENNTVKMTSVLRDSRVYIEGYGYNKINAAYLYGGPALATDTLNQNFDLDIEDYVTVNFAGLADLIDALGGVEIEITEDERSCINDILAVDGLEEAFLYESGLVRLTGAQATEYARIRSIDNDAYRAERQRTVITAMMTQMKDLSLGEMVNVLRLGMQMTETSLSYGELYSLAALAMSSDLQVESHVIPGEEDAAFGGIIDDVWYYDYDMDLAAAHLHEFIYGTAQAAEN